MGRDLQRRIRHRSAPPTWVRDGAEVFYQSPGGPQLIGVVAGACWVTACGHLAARLRDVRGVGDEAYATDRHAVVDVAHLQQRPSDVEVP